MSRPRHSPATDPAAERAERQLARLDELADIGMVLARALRNEVLRDEVRGDEVLGAEAGSVDAAAAAQAYAAIARSVRQCFLLQQKLATGEEERQAEAARKRAWAPTPQPKPPTRRDRLIDLMDELIERKAGDTQAALDAMDSEFCERLEDYGARDFEKRPLSAIIAEICKALGVEPDWDLWADQDWALEEAQAERPGSPYAADGRRGPSSSHRPLAGGPLRLPQGEERIEERPP